VRGKLSESSSSTSWKLQYSSAATLPTQRCSGTLQQAQSPGEGCGVFIGNVIAAPCSQ
jgi:hypothetical protein